ncbi:MAG: di-trans,poly-cis-decaprenylcistransferase, partial [Clostridia bacterium]|nr:di-trans,poly-cis-decaprenylcistransferase [Clostridia bacterium]
MKLFGKRRATLPEKSRFPRHIAIIMDGNGRWANKRGLPRKVGHGAGAERFREISEYCGELGIEALSVFAFSTENWNRPADEVDGILNLLRKYLDESCEKLAAKNARLRFLGRLDALPQDIRDKIARIDAISAKQTGIIVNVCINYGGRADIVDAAKRYAADCVAGKADPTILDEAAFSPYLSTEGLPDPDLLIRTGGEMRISNYLLWQSAYAELYFTDTLWPEFKPAELDAAIAWFAT